MCVCLPAAIYASHPSHVQKLTCTTTDLSSLNWDAEINGWGPAEKNQSNGEANSGDGSTLRIGNQSYSTGLGVHATSRVTYTLNGNYNRFASDIGVDEEVGNNGSVVFEVLLDGKLAYASPVLRGTDGPLSMELDVTGANEMVLIVSDGGDGNEYDHANWAGAILEADCNTEKCNPPVIPTLTSLSNNQAGFTWAYPIQGNYNIQYREVGTTAWSFIINIVNNTVLASNLNAGTTYEWQISTNCSAEQSEWVSGENFTTKGGGLVCGQITNLTKVSIGTFQARLSWGGTSGGNIRYREENEGTWDILPFSGTGITIYGLQAGKKYYWQVQEDCGNSMSNWVPGPSFTTKSANCNLPSGWTSQDIGSVKLPGSVCVENDTWTVEGAGSDIFGTSDEFHFVSLPLEGDGEIIARIQGIELTNGWAKAGLMIRRNQNANIKNVLIGLSASNGAILQYRTTNGGSTSFSGNGSEGLPNWLRLVRIGNKVTGYVSSNGSSWNRLGPEITLGAANMRIGLAVSSHDAGELASAVFSDIQLNTSTISYPGFVINPENLDVGYEGGTVSSNLSAPAAWVATSSDGFLSFDESGGNGFTTFNVTVAENMLNQPRTGKITITSGGESKELLINQAANPSPCSEPENLEVEEMGVSLARLDWDTEASLDYTLFYREKGTSDYDSIKDLQGTDLPYTLTGLNANTTYQWFVRAVCPSSQSANIFGEEFTALSENACSLPAGWMAIDLGNVGIPGEVCESGGEWTIHASGTDIWGQNDQFHYVYQKLEENMELTTRVSEIGNANVWAKAGLMIREKLNAGSPNIGIFVTSARGVQHQNRLEENQTTLRVTQDNLGAPHWLRIRRNGGLIKTYYSETGEPDTWTSLGESLSMGEGDLWIGMAHTSHNNSLINKAVFTDVNLKTIAPSLSLSPSTLSLPATAGDSSISVNANVAWIASKNAAWVTLGTNAGSGNGTLTFTYQANPATESRTTQVTVSGGGQTKTLTLNQAGKEVVPPQLSATPKSFELGMAAVDTSSTINANINWTASTTANWVTITTPSGAGNGTLEFSVSENTGENSRSTIILLDDGDGTTTSISISQAGKSTPPPPSITITAPDDNAVVSLPLTVYYEVENGIIAPDSFFIQYAIDDSLLGTWNKPDSITFLNLEEGPRKIKLTLASPGQGLTNASDSIVVNVSLPPYLSLEPDTIWVDASETTVPVELETNQNWTLIESANWISSGQISGNKSETIQLEIEDNPSVDARSTIVIVEGGELSDTVVVIQAGFVPPSCDSPSKLELAFLTDTSATISWSGVALAEKYTLRYKEEGASSWTEIIGITSTEQELVPLSSETSYVVEVRTICEFGESEWTDSLTFITYPADAPFCPQVLGLSDEVLSDSSVLLSWGSTAFFQDFIIRYKTEQGIAWMIIPSTQGDSSWLLEGLDPKLSYEWQVKGICSNDSALWSASSSFTTGTLFPPCQPVADLSVSQITDSTALVRWESEVATEGFILNWKVIGSTEESVSDTLFTSEYSLESLFPNTEYKLSVLSLCPGGGTVSSDTVEFRTTQGGVIPGESVFASFYLSQIGPAVQLDWTIKEEIKGNAWFSVERSLDGQFFERIASVELEEFIENEPKDFLYFDERVPYDEWMYYRVRLIFDGGLYTLTQTKRIKVEQPDIEAWVYPNPTEGKTQLSILSPGEVTLTLSLFSHLGNLIFKRELPVGAGWVKKEIDLTGLQQGMYYLNVYDPNPNPYIKQSKSIIIMIR
ncbi:MAG: NPCBM/NEW2 domain-containing protein [Bacteroidota bacterium]